MRLVVHELYPSGIKQSITAPRDTLVIAIRPHLYKHLNPAGSLKLQLLDSNQKLIDESESVLISEISSANYFHGYVRFNCLFKLKKNQTYYIKLVGVGYSFSESAYMGWCNDYDLQKYDRTYERNEGYYAALDMEIWERKLTTWED